MAEEFILSTTIEEKDYEQLFLLEWNCFDNFPEHAALFAGGLDPAQREANIKALKLGVFTGSNRVYAKLRDTKSGKIVAFASGRVHRGPRGILDTPAAPNMKLPRVEDPEDRAFFEFYWASVRDQMRETKEFQVPHVNLQVICVDPAWRRHGAGTILINWYQDCARNESIGRCALLGSLYATDVGFYKKLGFSQTGIIEVEDKDRFPGRAGTLNFVLSIDL